MSHQFVTALLQLAQVSAERCEAPWTWREQEGEELRGRDALLLSHEAELAAEVQLRGQAQRLITEGQRAFGELRGLLAGVPDQLLDAQPGGQEWTLRQALAHLLLVERRYRAQTAYALERGDDQPLYQKLESQVSEAEQQGGVLAWIERLAAERRETAAAITGAETLLHRPTVWVGFDVDVRFRLARFAGHLAEHTIQLEKTLAAVGWQPSEAQRLVRRISAARAGHELWSQPEVLAALDALHLRRAAELTGAS
ncbi:MAG: DinB family protein [Candidatus Dormibacteraeota bacterium]|uniref:DinB family protein n=1 Tax=Candidatus Dormibacter sp. TaxID=2973982 RepID=UPI0027EF65D3|nr:DinB family protein [Candidatus Dormibacteraeota bacterium]